MRVLFTVCLGLALLGVGVAQENPQDLFASVKLEATIRVQKHSMGADLVEITILDSQYPPDVLRAQIHRLGSDLHSEPRGVAIGKVSLLPNVPDGSFLRADFAVDGLADPGKGVYRLGPIARAMAGAPKGHEIHGFMVQFENQAPGGSTLERYGLEPGAPVSVVGGYQPGPIGLEYRISLNTQDPSKIFIPDSANEVPAPAPAQAPIAQPTPWFLYVSVGFFALAIGALVYSLTLRNAGPRLPSATKHQPKGTPRHR